LINLLWEYLEEDEGWFILCGTACYALIHGTEQNRNRCSTCNITSTNKESVVKSLSCSWLKYPYKSEHLEQSFSTEGLWWNSNEAIHVFHCTHHMECSFCYNEILVVYLVLQNVNMTFIEHEESSCNSTVCEIGAKGPLWEQCQCDLKTYWRAAKHISEGLWLVKYWETLIWRIKYCTRKGWCWQQRGIF